MKLFSAPCQVTSSIFPSPQICIKIGALGESIFAFDVYFSDGFPPTPVKFMTIFFFYYYFVGSSFASKIKFYDTKNVATNILDAVLLSSFLFYVLYVAAAAAFRQKANSVWPFFKLLLRMEDNGQHTHTYMLSRVVLSLTQSLLKIFISMPRQWHGHITRTRMRERVFEIGVGSLECGGCGHGHGLPGCRMQEFGVVEQQEVKPLATTWRRHWHVTIHTNKALVACSELLKFFLAFSIVLMNLVGNFS